MAAQQAQTTYTIGQALRQQTMWEVDYDQPTRGVHRVQATLYYWPVSDPTEGDEGDDDVAYNFQWETERVPAAGVEHIYRAREDGMRVSDYDGQTRIYASRAEAVAACVEALEKRIAKARAALTRLSGKEAR